MTKTGLAGASIWLFVADIFEVVRSFSEEKQAPENRINLES